MSRAKASILTRLRGFTVIELMLAISIMGVIVYALYSMFNQTQKALRNTETQSGVSDKARAIMEILVREIEQAQPTYLAVTEPDGDYHQITNFYSSLEFFQRIQTDNREGSGVRRRTNVLESFYFTTTETNWWNVVGYKVNHATNVVGELKRYAWTNNFRYHPDLFMKAAGGFLETPVTNEQFFHHIADGVIHFKMTPYDVNGRQLAYNSENKVPGLYKIYRTRSNGSPMTPHAKYNDVETNAVREANVLLRQYIQNSTNFTVASFRSNALPAFVELELGMLEEDALRQYYLMLSDKNPNAASFLQDKISKVHLFRQRIPIRTAAQ